MNLFNERVIELMGKYKGLKDKEAVFTAAFDRARWGFDLRAPRTKAQLEISQ